MARASKSSTKQIQDEALAWFARMNSGDVTPAEIGAHAEWLAASERHAREYAALEALWGDLDHMGDPRSLPQARPARAVVSRRAFLAGSAVAASAAGYVGIAGLPDFLTSDVATGTGSLQTATLRDGTSVSLDADTALALDFDAMQRDVRLLRGRARFAVAADPVRPFVVHAGGGRIAANGTRFVVHEWAGEVTVAVDDARVLVTTEGGQAAQLERGQEVSFGAARMGEVVASDFEAASAWQEGKLVFEDRPLRQVIADINRYRHGRIQIADDRLMDLRVSGVFNADDADGVLALVENTLPVRSFQLTPFLVFLRHA